MKPFSMRKFMSLLSLYFFSISALSGAILFFTPPTRVANAIHWTFLGLAKAEHVRFHVIFSSLFAIVAMVHIYYNFTAIKLYLREKWAGVHFLRSESMLAILITAVIIIGTLSNTFPVSQIMSWSDSLKSSWETGAGVGTIPRGGGTNGAGRKAK